MHYAQTHQTETIYNAMCGVDTLYISKKKLCTWAHGKQGVTKSQGTSFLAVTQKAHELHIQFQYSLSYCHVCCHDISRAQGIGTEICTKFQVTPLPTTPSSDNKQLMCAEDSRNSGWLGKNQTAIRIFQGQADGGVWKIWAVMTSELQMDRPFCCERAGKVSMQVN